MTSNGYLRLDPNVLHFAVYTAGMLLAKLGKEEVLDCIAGLKQYGYAYEETFDQAEEMERLYQQNTLIANPLNFTLDGVLAPHAHNIPVLPPVSFRPWTNIHLSDPYNHQSFYSTVSAHTI